MGSKPRKDETVVLLHGILKSRFDMALIAHHLENEGYDVINISYPSREMELEQLSDFVKKELELRPSFNTASKVHFVTHSMGGLITRYFLHKHRPDNLGRVVMLSPPNQGSDFADFMTETKALKGIYDKLFGPAGAQLRTDHKHAIDKKVDFPLGIIGGNASINPLAPWVLGNNGDHDGIVPIERMKIEGMTDMIILKTSHMLMVLSPEVRKQVSHFLEHEKFDHPKGPV